MAPIDGQPTLEALNTSDPESFVRALDGIWEHAPWVVRGVADQRPFASVDALHRAMVRVVATQPEDRRVALFAGHPELAGADARRGSMTEASIDEQGTLSLDRLGADEVGRWDRLNRAYRERFGFPFILCIRRHGRESALAEFERRLDNERTVELDATLAEIARITRLRLAARIADHGLADIAGRLTAEVHDAANRVPAAGLRVMLHDLSCGDTGALIADTLTDDDGRTGSLWSGAPLRIGRYRLRFDVGAYYRLRETGHPPLPFDVVTVELSVTDPEGAHHLPIRVAPTGYRVGKA